MSLLTAVTNVANEAGYVVGSTVIGSTDVTTKQLLAIAQRVAAEMAIAYPWTKLYASGAITLAAGQESYALPAAFSSAHYETFWNQSTRWRVLGPMSPQEFAQQKGYGLITTVYRRYQIRGVSNNQLYIEPPPGAAENGQTIIFEYIADRHIRPMIWAQGQVITSGQYRFYNGNYYQASNAATTGATPPTHTSGSASDGAVTWAYYSGAYNQFLADTDEIVLPQRILEQGMLERYAEIHGIQTVQPKFLTQLNEEFAKDLTGKVLYAGGDSSRLQFARAGKAVFGTWI